MNKLQIIFFVLIVGDSCLGRLAKLPKFPKLRMRINDLMKKPGAIAAGGGIIGYIVSEVLDAIVQAIEAKDEDVLQDFFPITFKIKSNEIIMRYTDFNMEYLFQKINDEVPRVNAICVSGEITSYCYCTF